MNLNSRWLFSCKQTSLLVYRVSSRRPLEISLRNVTCPIEHQFRYPSVEEDSRLTKAE